jgi:hypothetical protein
MLDKAPNFSHSEYREDPYDVVDFFCENKFSDELEEEFRLLTGVDPRRFFTEDTFEILQHKEAGERIVLLANAALYVSTSPDDIGLYLDYFPEDTESLKALVDQYSDRLPDGITLVLVSLLANRFPEQNRNPQMSEIYERRKLAPNFLLTGYEYGVGSDQLTSQFGSAAEGYVEASQEARDLWFDGNELFSKRAPFDNPEFEALEEREKSRMLRMCLGARQLTLVFEEALNSAFTAESVQEQNDRYQKSRSVSLGYGIDYNPAHSIIFGSIQENSSYDLPVSFFEQEMNSTAEIGGSVEEYADHKLTLAVIEAFTKRNPDPENVSLLVDFWNKNRNPIFGNAIAEALSIRTGSNWHVYRRSAIHGSVI